MRPTVVSLFTGAGGIDLGLEAAGFEVVTTVEQNSSARATLSRNRPGWPQDSIHDVFEFADERLPTRLGLAAGSLDLLAGGPPCQPFSKAAQWSAAGRRGAKDGRAHCIDAFVCVAERLRPKLLLIENVPGFVRREGSGYARLASQLDEVRRRTKLRYRLSSAVLDSYEYGVPQTRRRSFVVGVRDDIATTFEWPEPVARQDRRCAGDALANLVISSPPSPSGKWASLLPSIPAGENYAYLTPEGRGVALFGARTRFWSFLLKLHPKQPSWTLPASPGPSTGPFHWENRPLAPLEMARLQTFPVGWAFDGSTVVATRQVGNAAPPLLVEHVGRRLAAVLGAKPGNDLVHRIEVATAIPRAPAAKAVPERFLSNIGSLERHAGTGKGPRPRVTPVG